MSIMNNVALRVEKNLNEVKDIKSVNSFKKFEKNTDSCIGGLYANFGNLGDSRSYHQVVYVSCENRKELIDM